jgi:hypothetical protein
MPENNELFLLLHMNPTVLRYKEYRFFFFSREERRIHIHVTAQNGEAKFWIEPGIELAQNISFSEKQLNEIKRILLKHKNEITEAWVEHFNS